MTDSLDDFIKAIQHQANDETKRACEAVAFGRWLRPQFVGAMEDPDGYSHVAGFCAAKVPEQAKAWDEVAVDARAQVLGQARAATASVPTAGKNPHINWGPLALSNDVPSAEP